MRIPTRRGEKNNQRANDPLMTQAKYDELKKKLDHLQSIQPAAAKEVQRLAEMGDFSENAAYQMAKGRLRGINQRIMELEDQLAHAELITPNKNADTIAVGHFVTVAVNGARKTYQILGSTETNPASGVISRHSPLGQALLGRKVGDAISVQLANKAVEYKIVKIE